VNSYYFYKNFTKDNLSVNLLNKPQIIYFIYFISLNKEPDYWLRNYSSYNLSVISLIREPAKLITIKNNWNNALLILILNPLIIDNLKSKPVKIYYNAERYNIIKEYRGIGGIYLFYIFSKWKKICWQLY